MLIVLVVLIVQIALIARSVDLADCVVCVDFSNCADSAVCVCVLVDLIVLLMFVVLIVIVDDLNVPSCEDRFPDARCRDWLRCLGRGGAQRSRADLLQALRCHTDGPVRTGPDRVGGSAARRIGSSGCLRL